MSDCDAGLKFTWPVRSDEFLGVISSKIGDRFRVFKLRTTDRLESQQTVAVDYTIRVQINQQMQQIVGFGGGITDSSAKMIWQLKEPARSRLLDDYFGPMGLNYNMGRIPIAGTDMSSRPYTYDDLHEPGDEDFELSKWKLQPEDLELKVPLIRRVNEMRASRSLGPLKLLASSWSAPAWMKDNHNLVQGSLKSRSGETSLAENPYYRCYARYIVRFLNAYKMLNLPVWGLSPQNEPRSPGRVGPKVIHHNSVNFTPDQLAAFYRFHLIPELSKANFTREKLNQFIWEDTLDDVKPYLESLLAEPTIRDNVIGIALHWYAQGLHEIPYTKLLQVHRSNPFRYSMISTEASFLGGQKPGDWGHGERYSRDIIETLRAGFIGWLDWNLALDPSGGPSWANNPLDSAVQVDLSSQSYIKNPTYYALGHVTRFILPGSNIVQSTIQPAQARISSAVDFRTQEIYSLACELEKPQVSADGMIRRQISLVLLNRAESNRTLRLELPDCRAKWKQSDLVMEMKGRSIVSLAFVC